MKQDGKLDMLRCKSLVLTCSILVQIIGFAITPESTAATSAASTAVSLPPDDTAFTSAVVELVVQSRLDEPVPASANVDKEDETASICVVDLSNPEGPVVAGWNAENFIYPASTYKMYVLGEVIRQVCAGERSLDDITTVAGHNVREREPLTSGTAVPLSEILRLMCMYSNNTAANVAIDTADRKRVTALLHSLGCEGSDITRKFLPRTREDAEFTSAPSTTSCARHFATFLYAVEKGAIGNGKGRGLIKGYLGTNVQNKTRFAAGLPRTATIYSKTGEWSNFTAEAALVEDGDIKYIVCVMTPFEIETAAPRMAAFVRDLHALIGKRAHSTKL